MNGITVAKRLVEIDEYVWACPDCGDECRQIRGRGGPPIEPALCEKCAAEAHRDELWVDWAMENSSFLGVRLAYVEFNECSAPIKIIFEGKYYMAVRAVYDACGEQAYLEFEQDLRRPGSLIVVGGATDAGR